MYQFSDKGRQALEHVSLPLVFFQDVDGQNVPLLVSDGFCNLLGITRDQMMNEQSRCKFDRIHPEDVGRISEAVHSFWKKESNYDVVYRVRYSDNTYHYIHSVAFWWPMEDGTEVILVIYLDLYKWSHEVKQAADRYELFQQDRFYTDALTGLPNINYLNQFADERVNLIRAHDGTPVLVYTDTRSMQFYNNQYGFSRGNDLLCLIAGELKSAFPEGLVVRGADDHFVVIDTFPGADELAGKIDTVDENVRKQAYGSTSGIQAGIVLFDEEAKTAEAVDQARQAVRLISDDMNKVVKFYSRTDDDLYWNQRYILENFDRALEEGWIKIYYQCISRVETGKGSALDRSRPRYHPARCVCSGSEKVSSPLQTGSLYGGTGLQGNTGP